MTQGYASMLIDAPVEAVWAAVRDFGDMSWLPGVVDCRIEGGRDSDSVGCVRVFAIGDGATASERLLELDDSRYRFVYSFVKPAFPIENYVATFELIPVTDGNRTFAQWSATFDEAPDDRGKYSDIVSQHVFAAGLASLKGLVAGRAAPAHAVRWQGLRPAKVFVSSVIEADIDAAWARMRDFAGMDGWHPGLRDMHMLDGARSDKVSGIREFSLDAGDLHEQLTLMSDAEHAFRYRILKSPMPWLNYHAGAKLLPITATGTTLAVWTADWVASAIDDASLIPDIGTNVFQLALSTLSGQLAGRTAA